MGPALRSHAGLPGRIGAPRGDYDLSGYLGLDPKIPPGYLNITYSVEVDTDADPAVLEEIRAAAENGSPVTQNVLQGTPIQSEIKKL